ncbi:MAG: hypothetical protein GX879_04905 [Bacteroidales bacterium]|nr:hypothetical protein [Bacteroidales bacterium]
MQIIEVAGVNFKNIVHGMTNEHIEKQGYKLIEKMDLTNAIGQAATCFVVGFKSGDIEYERLMYFTGETKAIWINTNYPKEMKKLLLPALIASLLTAQ